MIAMIVICAALAVLGGDALYSRAKLRLRTNATRGARRQHELTTGESRGGWRSLEDIHREAEGQAGGAADDENPFTRLGRSSGRHR
jgi:hypothetical protein